jgi:hypothetical protein
VHLPPSGERAVPLESGGTVLLDRAFELDDAPLYERFYLVTGPAPFELAPVVEALRGAVASARAGAAAEALPLPATYSQTAFSLRKDSRP